MKKILVWDLPSRLLHWAFAGSIAAALLIASIVDDDSPLFQLHMLFGIVAVFVLVLRLIWGLFGSRYSQFRNFPLRPTQVLEYFSGILTGQHRDYVGNNPGSALAAVAMFALVPLIVVTGIGFGGEITEDIHGALAYVLLGVIGVHLLGIAIHTVLRKENIAASMLHGRQIGPEAAALRSSHPIVATLLLVSGAAWIVALFAGHNAAAATVKVPVLGTVVQLGENESGEHGSKKGEHGDHGRKRDDDDDD
ncbi:hypothetical protein DB347_09145 [Opitutaceae bacterium EW11]|nr:hypothetical protein DB347_09145 [Opitutaceae bacterium EW11]